MNEVIDIVELFSGIGGFSKGLINAGYTLRKHYYSEIDKHAIANYQYNFKNAKHIGSVTDVRGSELERPDLVTFGWPCQDNSIAGKRKGQKTGTRSGLLFEATRIISECKPRYFIAENVKGLSSVNKGADFYEAIRVLTYLSESLPQYELEMQLCNTTWFLPQNRERFYFIGCLRGTGGSKVFPITESDFGTIERQSITAIVRTLTAGGNSGGHHSGMTLLQLGRGYNKGGEHEICPTISSNSFENKNFVKAVLTPDRKEKRQNGRRFKEDGEPMFTLTKQDLHGVKINKVGMINSSQDGIIHGVDGLSQTLSSGHGNVPKIQDKTEIRRLTEIECERLQGYPDNWTRYGIYNGVKKEISKTQRYKLCGNAVTTNIIKFIGERLRTV